MTDYLEMKHGFETLNNIFRDKPKYDMFAKSLDACVPGVAKEAIDSFNAKLNKIESGTFISSISEHSDEEDLHGRLSMWRSFCGETGRVAIIFKLPWFKTGLSTAIRELKILFSPVLYLPKDSYNKEFDQIIRNINSNCEFLRSVNRDTIVQGIFSMLLIGTVCIKHYGFKEEKEWRVIHIPNIWNSPLINHETQIINGIPQKIYKLPLDVSVSPALADLDFPCIFDRLIIGPTQYSWAMYEAFSEALLNAGVKDAYKQVCISDIPIRT